MNGNDMKAARMEIGNAWMLGRPLGVAELARVLRLSDQTITNYESGATPIPYPVELCCYFMQRCLPPGGVSARHPGGVAPATKSKRRKPQP